MSLDRVFRASDLLGQATKPAAPARLQVERVPQLDLAWGSFHQGIGSSLSVVFSRSKVPKGFLTRGFFKDSWIERRIPRRALVAAALWHFVFVFMPFPQLPAATRRSSAFDNTELTWSGPINDFPLMDRKSLKPKPSPRGEPGKLVPRQGADAFHPRQHIFTDPVHATHPRQTLIHSAAPLEPPKILPNLPNVVEFRQLPGPARPRLQISKEELAKLRPREPRAAQVTSAPPDAPALDPKVAEIALLASPHAPARPKLELNTGVAPRLAPRAQTGDAGPAPDLGARQPNAGNGNPRTFIALSATPAPPAPVGPPPEGNLAARVSISPEGKQPGVPGGSPEGAAGATGGAGGGPGSSGGAGTGHGDGKIALDVSISGGNPPMINGAPGLGGSPKISAAAPHAPIARPDAHTKMDDAPERNGSPDFAALPRGAQPEQIFASKKIYKMLVNMPNLNSATGSWVLSFSELRVNSDGPQPTSSDISGPVPLRKIDPKYPPTLILEHVEGEVVLYAVIRRDGSVDSIQLVHGIDEKLDANAMDALSQWKFRPASRQGSPVELEAIVHIPFHPPAER